jgi:hypothetical protein
MKNKFNRTKIIAFVIIAIFYLLFFAGLTVSAQRPIPLNTRRIEELNRQSEQFERDRMSREKNGQSPSVEDAKRTQKLKALIKEDFESLQTAYNKIVINLQSGDELSREFILASSGEIKKYAARLKTNLALPELKDEKKNLPDEDRDLADKRKSLRMLCRHIYDFVTNPMFNQPTGLDVEQSTKARRDLEKIIELSQQINKSMEK